MPDEYEHFKVIERVSRLEAQLDAERVLSRSMRDEMNLRYEQRFAAQESAIASAKASTADAISKQDRSTELRFDSVNEFRKTLTDQANEFARVGDVKSLNDKISALEKWQDRNEGRGSGLNAGWVYLIGAGTILLSLYMAYKHGV